MRSRRINWVAFPVSKSLLRSLTKVNSSFHPEPQPKTRLKWAIQKPQEPNTQASCSEMVKLKQAYSCPCSWGLKIFFPKVAEYLFPLELLEYYLRTVKTHSTALSSQDGHGSSMQGVDLKSSPGILYTSSVWTGQN